MLWRGFLSEGVAALRCDNVRVRKAQRGIGVLLAISSLREQSEGGGPGPGWAWAFASREPSTLLPWYVRTCGVQQWFLSGPLTPKLPPSPTSTNTCRCPHPGADSGTDTSTQHRTPDTGTLRGTSGTDAVRCSRVTAHDFPGGAEPRPRDAEPDGGNGAVDRFGLGFGRGDF